MVEFGEARLVRTRNEASHVHILWFVSDIIRKVEAGHRYKPA
jgi:hypothetical protein